MFDFNDSLYKKISSEYKLLSIEEERKLITDYRKDEKRLRELLVLHNVRSAMSIGKRYSRKSRLDTEDDGVQRAMVGLYKASQSYNLDSGVRFITYATWKMIAEAKYNCHENLADSKLNDLLCSIDAPIGNSHEPDEHCLIDVVDKMIVPEYKEVGSSESETLSEDFEYVLLCALDSVRFLTKKKKDIFKDWIETKVSKEGSMNTIAEKYGTTHQTIGTIIDEVKSKVKKILEEYYSEEEEVKDVLNTKRETKLEEQKNEDEFSSSRKDTFKNDMIERLRARLNSQALDKHGIDRDKSKIKIGTNIVIARMHKKSAKIKGAKTTWRPESTAQRLSCTFRQEKYSMGIIDLSNKELKSKRLHSIRKLIKESDFFASQENNEIDLENEKQVVSMSQRLQESILANGEHNDDAYEIQEADD